MFEIFQKCLKLERYFEWKDYYEVFENSYDSRSLTKINIVDPLRS